MTRPNEEGRLAANETALSESETEATTKALPERSIGASSDAARKTSRLLAWRKAIAASDLSSTQKLVALVLSLHMNGDGASCFPSQKTVAAEASLTERAVRDTIPKLVEAGWIRREQGRRVNGHPDHYYATTPEHRNDVPGNHVPRPEPRSSNTGTTFQEHRNDVPPRTSGGRPKDVLSTGEEDDAVAREARTGSPWEVASVSTLDTVATFATEAEAEAFADGKPDLYPRPVTA